MDSQTIALWFSNYENLAMKALRPNLAVRFGSLSRFFAQDAARQHPAATGVDDDALLETAAGLIAECSVEAYPRLQRSAVSNRGILRVSVWGGKVATILKSMIGRVTAKGNALLDEGQAFFVCDACGFVFIGSSAPEICPVCKAPAARFVRY
jgi:hypothetical protein